MGFLKDLAIKTKFTIFIGFLFIVVLITGGIIVSVQDQQKASFVAVSEVSGSITDHVMPLSILIKEIQLNIVQTQQWLTDISATRGLDGLNDGYDEAQKQEKAFYENIDAALKICEEAGFDDIKKSLIMTRENYVPYYNTGKKMAADYIEFGPSHGNVTMGEFDKAAAKMAESLDELLGKTQSLNHEKEQAIKTDLLMVNEKNQILLTTLILSAVSILSILFLILLMLQVTVTKPIQNIFQGVLELSKGNYNFAFIYAKNKDETGQISHALESFKEQLAENVSLKLEHEKQAVLAEKNKRTMMNDLAQSFENEVGQAIKQISDASVQMQQMAKSMSENSDITTNKAKDVTVVVAESSANINAVAGASEELSASINEISSQVITSSKIANEASVKATAMSSRMQNLVEAVAKIGEVVTLISDIAEQTNLLALNATIEAARAGEAGKGFAVVANEVKSLATETAKATNEISLQIGNIQNATKDSENAIGDILEVIRRVDEILGTVSAAVEEQGAATSEIARNVQQASQGSENVSYNINEVLSATHNTGESASKVLMSAEELAQQAGILNISVNKFIGNIKSK